MNFQMNRTVLHYAARCADKTTRLEITDEAIMNGADKFARDAFGNDADYYITNEFVKSQEEKKTMNGHQTEPSDNEVFEDSSPTIENAIQEKDFDKLVKYVLEGDADRLAERSSEDEEMQEFIKNIPAFQVCLFLT